MPADLKSFLGSLVTYGPERYLAEYQRAYMSGSIQDALSNAAGFHMLRAADKANMLEMMQAWLRDHQGGLTVDPFMTEYLKWAHPLRSAESKARLGAAAAGGLAAQVAEAARIRDERRLFGWDKNKHYSAAINDLEQSMEARQSARLKGLRKFGNQFTEPLGNGDAGPSSQDIAARFKSALQAVLLDGIFHEYKQVRLLFTTAKLVGGSGFVRVLGSSHELYRQGFIMNPSTLKTYAPAASSINWDMRLNDFFLHTGIDRGAAFVFVTAGVDYSTFLDPATRDPHKRELMAANPVGAVIRGLGTWGDRNYPTKPGGSEVLALLEWGYGLENKWNDALAAANMGFVLLPRRGNGLRSERFLHIHSRFKIANYNRLLRFLDQLKLCGIAR